jgi:large subunit ribosomal protein L29
MKSQRFNEMTQDDLLREEKEMGEQLFKLRFQSAVGRVENPSKIRTVRRDIARVKTRLGELKRQATAETKA